ncbi:AzlD domain-containing protein [Brevibacillus dissolubilis]|uniref:AzlD domain-containing protein n=1 Tax=Brevibacillus dissolubilis TaxID=1844116 RepID=UPI00111703BA|nr:AzlD domain-containing protein [Brevibacillus dissolubilis]
MSSGTILLMFVLSGAATYLTRRAFLQLPSGFFSPRLKNGMTFIPIGIFAALIFPSLFLDGGQFVFQPTFLVASVICMGLMILTKNVFASFGISLLLVVLVYVGILPFPH